MAITQGYATLIQVKAALGAGLTTNVARAEELAKFGVTAEKAREGFRAAVPLIERGGQLAAFYGEEPYTQGTAEEEIFGLTYAPEAGFKADEPLSQLAPLFHKLLMPAEPPKFL